MKDWKQLVAFLKCTTKRSYDAAAGEEWANLPLPQTLAGKLVEHDRLCRTLGLCPVLLKRKHQLERTISVMLIGREVLRETGRANLIIPHCR